MDFEKRQDELDFCLDSYNYHLESSLIANIPKKERHNSRMMIVRELSSSQEFSINKLTINLVDEIDKGDLVVVNDTKVMKARLKIQLLNGVQIELLVLEKKENSIWLCLAKPAKKLKINTLMKLNLIHGKYIHLRVVDIDEETGGRLIEFPSAIDNLISMNNLLDSCGEIPLPPYIKTNEDSSFHEKVYQTKYAKNPGAIAAPTAGLHLSDEIIDLLKNKGVKVMPITLHVGYGTFKPIDTNNLKELKLHREFASVSNSVIEEIKKTKASGNKIIAIGTTSVRALESCFSLKEKDIIPIDKNVDLVIKPGYKFKVVDGLLTNFHLPKSSLLLLVSAMIGRVRLLKLYDIAIKEKFRFFSYGDAMFITPDAFLKESKIRL